MASSEAASVLKLVSAFHPNLPQQGQTHCSLLDATGGNISFPDSMSDFRSSK
jgi:hypothetical protein